MTALGLSDPLYLTDAERPIRPPDVQDRYRFFVVFRLRGIQYTRWFADIGAREAYIKNLPGVQQMNAGEAKTRAIAQRDTALVEGLNHPWLKR